MKAFTALALASGLACVGAETIHVAAGDDFEATCLHVVQPGDTCYLESGEYLHDGLTVTHGRADARITITGDTSACIKGSNTQDRVLQIAHDYYTIDGICFDGDHGGDGHVSTAVYVLGADTKSTKNGVTSSVTGLEMLNLEIKNFGSECVHFRYFVTHAEVYGCTFLSCGVEDFSGGGGGKVGEGIYLGTALDQVNDGKAPEPKIRSGGSDDIEVDECSHNLIHFNTFRTYGNECVDVKEGSYNNIIEENVCEMQKDENSGGFGLRGSDNIVRFNEISSCDGAAVRIGGDQGYGTNNHVYGNKITDMAYGAFNLMSTDHGEICGNDVSDATLAVGSYKEDLDATVAISSCQTTPSDYDKFDYFPSRSGGSTDVQSSNDEEAASSDSTDGTDGTDSTDGTDGTDGNDGTDGTDSTDGTDGTDSTDSTESSDSSNANRSNSDSDSSENSDVTIDAFADDGPEAGVNGAAEPSPTHIEVVETNTIRVPNEEGECSTLVSTSHVQVDHSIYVDASTDIDNLFDGDHDTYFSVHRESTTITFELAAETNIEGVSIGFFIKNGEDRIQTFDVSVLAADGTDWTTVISGEESDGTTSSQHFEFTSPHQALYVQFKSRGNTFNNWTALTEFHVCAASEGESNALFGGARAVSKELQQLAGGVCASPKLLTPRKVRAGGKDNVNALFDGNFKTRWSTLETTNENDLQNGMITMHFIGDQNISRVKISFFDGDLAKQHFSLYKQSASERTWTPVLSHHLAERRENLQTFDINETGVNRLYIVGNGNDVGQYTKISEVQVWGC